MPIYLAHGFRWPRDGFTGIRVHAIVNNLDDVSVEYIQTPSCRATLLQSLRSLYPTLIKPLETGARRLDFLEQYDPEDTSTGAVSQPYAFVCDWILMIAGGPTPDRAEYYASQLLQNQAAQKAAQTQPQSPTQQDPQIQNRNSSTSNSSQKSLTPSAKVRAKTQPMSIAAPFNSPATITALSVNISDVIADTPPLSTEAWDALADLRDKLAEGEKIGWWVVYNGDPDRDYPPSESEYDEEEGAEEEGEETETGETTPEFSQRSSHVSTNTSMPVPVPGARPSQLSTQSPSTATQSTAPPLTAQRVRSPMGGRIPPPVPPAPATKTPCSPNVTAAKPLPIRPPALQEPVEITAKEKEKEKAKDALPKSSGLRRKIFGGVGRK